MKYIFLVLAAFFYITPAAAQNQQLSQTNPMIDSISVDEMAILLEQLDFTASFMSELDGDSKIIEATAGGVAFYFALRQCNGPGAAARCTLVEPFGFFDSRGVTLSQINQFNMHHATRAFAGLADDGSGLVAAKIYLTHGISAANYLFSLGLYFNDFATLLEAIEPGVLAQIRYRSDDSKAAPGAGVTGLASGFAIRPGLRLPGGQEFKVNAVGRKAPSFMTDGVRAVLDGRNPAPQGME